MGFATPARLLQQTIRTWSSQPGAVQRPTRMKNILLHGKQRRGGGGHSSPANPHLCQDTIFCGGNLWRTQSWSPCPFVERNQGAVVTSMTSMSEERETGIHAGSLESETQGCMSSPSLQTPPHFDPRRVASSPFAMGQYVYLVSSVNTLCVSCLRYISLSYCTGK